MQDRPLDTFLFQRLTEPAQCCYQPADSSPLLMAIVPAGFTVTITTTEFESAGFDLFSRTRTERYDLAVENECFPCHGRIQIDGNVVICPFDDITADVIAFIILQRNQTPLLDREAIREQAAFQFNDIFRVMA